MTAKTEKPAHKTVAEVLHFIQKNLKAPKGQVNKFGNYNYRSCEDIIEAVKNVLPEGATIKVTDDITMIGTRHYIKATASLCFAGECESVTAFARESESKKGMDDAQLTGATSSYARKYALNGLFAIDDTKDADATNDHGKGDKAEPEAKTEPNTVQPMNDEEFHLLKTSVAESITSELLDQSKAKAKAGWKRMSPDQRDQITKLIAAADRKINPETPNPLDA